MSTSRPSSLACTECRRKHLKCDAVMPVCTRCKDGGLKCHFLPSRRGCGARARRHVSSQAPASSQPRPPLHSTPPQDVTNQRLLDNPVHNDSSARMSNISPAPTWANLSTGGMDKAHAQVFTPMSTPASTASAASSNLRSGDEHLTNLYFSSFHQGHPLLVPRSRYGQQNYPEYLKIIVRFIGSHYATDIDCESLRSASALCLSENSNLRSPEMVAGLVLYAIALHSRYEPMEAMSAIMRAADMAINLGMHMQEFAPRHSPEDVVYQESLRRIWWELYVTDGYLASLHRQTSFKSNEVHATALLPCEEPAYDTCSLPLHAWSLTQYDGRLFADVDQHFSSFTYRIDAVRILGRVIAVSSINEIRADKVQAIDNAIASWRHYLPHEKAGIIDHAGNVDQMVFQAVMILQCAGIFLHFPRSELPITMPASAEVACARRHMERVSPIAGSQHAAKALSASKDLANLASLPIQQYDPFFVCVLVFACVVQLSACCAYPKDTIQQYRDRVALIIGTLKFLSRTWAVSQHVSQQLRRAANEIFNPQIDVVNAACSSSSYDSGVGDMAFLTADIPLVDFFYSNDGMQGLLGQGMGAGVLHEI